MKKLRIAFAGFRHEHIFSLYETVLNNSDRFEICGIFEDDINTVKLLKEKNMLVTHSSYQEMLNDKTIDIIAIGNYYGIRGKMAISALKAGKHIISDKPLCTSIDELNVIEQISGQNNLKVGMMLDLRDNKNVFTAIDLIESGTIGKINNIVFTGQHPLNYGIRPNWYFEKGKHGGVINDIAIHGIDIVRLITNSDVEKVNATRCWNFYAKKEPDFLDNAQFMVTLSSGAGVIADVSYSAPNKCGFDMMSYWRFLVSGENGTIQFGYNGETVDVYLNNSQTKTEFVSENPKKNYLDRFFEDILCSNGNTDECIKSTHQTLIIQEYANKIT